MVCQRGPWSPGGGAKHSLRAYVRKITCPLLEIGLIRPWSTLICSLRYTLADVFHIFVHAVQCTAYA